MPPKRAKKTAPAADTSWETGLKSAQFEECSWKACVSLLAGGTPADEELMGPLQLAVQQPQRRLFTLVSQEAIVATIHHLGNPKAKKPKDVAMFHEVTEQAKVLLDAGQEVPCELMANILKFQLLQVKASDQQRMAAKKVFRYLQHVGATKLYLSVKSALTGGIGIIRNLGLGLVL
ncbi:hypothetical protein NHX12_014401 [Muraenolepis orangiensis]|uniref:Uncharacterized protein n=1 Tax=Muraenolepis orangiensis TaxID=630683 RepID=A0A9Q0DCE4_9TELE|nr:hypothetical protein NHX12_014401 [Muraenolepis orangiensis]